jgi:MFS family permease
MMGQEMLTRDTLRTPRAAAAAGIVFALLLIVVVWLLRSALPADPLEPGAWLRTSRGTVALALNLVPFAGIAFLWFIGALRDRLGQREDRFFATVFFGSGLLFLAMLFAASASVGAIILAFAEEPKGLLDSATFRFARALSYGIVNIYMIKIAAVFMISTSTVAISTRFAPRWIALLGYALALIILFGSYYIDWSFIVFPLWIFLISTYILIEEMRRST